MQLLYDENGRRYLDAFGGIVTMSVGHCRPSMVEKAREQLETSQHTTQLPPIPMSRRLHSKMKLSEMCTAKG